MEIRLPSWAEICGVDGYLLVPEELGRSPTGLLSWEEVDWWLVAFCYLEGPYERVYESKMAPYILIASGYRIGMKGHGGTLGEFE